MKVQYPGVAKSIQSDIRNEAVSKYLFEETKNYEMKIQKNDNLKRRKLLKVAAFFKLAIVFFFVA